AAEILGWHDDERVQAHTLASDTPGPGNALSIVIESEHVTEVFTGFGERGVRAEAVATNAANEAKRYLDTSVAVGEHLADQLLLPMALGDGGSFTTFRPSTHTTTNVEIIRRFVDVAIAVEEGDVTRIVVG